MISDMLPKQNVINDGRGNVYIASERVLVSLKSGIVEIDYLIDGEWACWGKRVMAWTHLPKPHNNI